MTESDVIAERPESDFRTRVETALQRLREGRMLLVVDGQTHDKEGALVLAAQFADPKKVAFMVRYSNGLICVAMTEERADTLRLPLMVNHGEDPRGTVGRAAFAVSVDLREGTTTGISSTDRACTARALADPGTRPTDLTRPGHVLPLRACPGGVLQRRGHTESAVDLCRLAGLEAVGALAALINDDGTIARRGELTEFADLHDIAILTVGDIVRYRQDTETLVRREASGRLPSRHGQFNAISFRSVLDGLEHIALVAGDVDQDVGDSGPVLVRVHSECLTGDVFGSRRCDCGTQLDMALARIGAEGRGVVVYLRGHEGRGVGLSNKLRAYTLQDVGFDTVDANLVQGLPADAREYGVGAHMLRELGVRSVVLMTNNPDKCASLTYHGITVTGREPILVDPNPDNIAYLTTKRSRMNHLLGECS
jgi:3,4-dihydroxy 2-butanone 4-phosphate synthase / GTP cyclohydrolase II